MKCKMIVKRAGGTAMEHKEALKSNYTIGISEESLPILRSMVMASSKNIDINL